MIKVRKTKQLNINNTFRSLNFNLFNPKADNLIILSRVSNKVIKNLIDNNKLNDYLFIVDNHSVRTNKYFNDIFKSKAHLLYLAKTIFPVDLLFTLGNRRNFEIIYYYKDQYSLTELQNMDVVSKVYNIGIYVPVAPNKNIVKYLFGLNDVRYTLAYKAYFDYTLSKHEHSVNSKKLLENYYINNEYELYDATPEKKIEDFKLIHECLARWRIQCYLDCIDAESYTKLKEYIRKV